MCNCNQNNLKPEYEMLLSGEDETNNELFETSTVFHRNLGPGRYVSAQQEGETFEVPKRRAFHPVLGKGRVVPKSSVLNSEYEIVGDADERVKVTNGKDVPFRWVCHLKLLFPDPDDSSSFIEFGGSGVLISPRHILTAGHCLFSDVDGSNGTTANKEVAKVIATPGKTGNSAGPFGSAISAKIQYSSTWRSSLDYRFDFGLITLKEDIGSKPMSSLGGKVLGYWGSPTSGEGTRINPKDRSQLQNISVNISGYPGDKPHGEQWRAFGKITHPTPKAGSQLIYYDFDTCAGHSGAPVWIRWENFRNIVAIHTGPCIPGSDCSRVAGGKPCFPDGSRYTSNRGIFITSTVMTQIKQWMNT
jgi:V8-like Glu-specific endopeptidase